MKKLITILGLLVVLEGGYAQTNLTLNSNEVPNTTPNISVGWTESASSIIRTATLIAKGGSANTLLLTLDNSSASASTLYARYVTPSLAAQDISGTIKGQLRMLMSGTSGSTAFSYVVVSVINPAGVIVATLLAGQLGDFALSTTTQNRKTPPAGASLSSYTCATGDRILIEIGVKRTVGTTARTATIVFTAVAGGTNLPEDNTTTTSGNSWVEFSQTLKFNTGITYIFYSGKLKTDRYEKDYYGIYNDIRAKDMLLTSEARFYSQENEGRHSNN